MYTGLTKAGEIYLANRLANKLPVNFLKVKIGNGTVPHGADASETTELYSFKKEIQILDITQTDNVARIRVLIDNSDVEQGFFMKELGVYVDDNGKEKLYWYVYEDNGQYVHSKTERAIQFDLELVMEVTSSNSTILDWNKDKVWISKNYFDEKVRTFEIPTIAELQSRKNLKVGDIVEVLGYYTAGDGAGHKRIIANEDDGSGVQLNNKLWANIVHNGEVNVSWFGAKGDGVADDTLIIQKAVDFGEQVILTKKYKVTQTINNIKHLFISDNCVINIEADIDGFLLTGDKKVIRGTGMIKVNVDNYSHAVIKVIGPSSNCCIDTIIQGKLYNKASGIGILFDTENGRHFGHNITGTVEFFDKGIYINSNKSWCNNFYFNIIVRFNNISILIDGENGNGGHYGILRGQCGLYTKEGCIIRANSPRSYSLWDVQVFDTGNEGNNSVCLDIIEGYANLPVSDSYRNKFRGNWKSNFSLNGVMHEGSCLKNCLNQPWVTTETIGNATLESYDFTSYGNKNADIAKIAKIGVNNKTNGVRYIFNLPSVVAVGYITLVFPTSKIVPEKIKITLCSDSSQEEVILDGDSIASGRTFAVEELFTWNVFYQCNKIILEIIGNKYNNNGEYLSLSYFGVFDRFKRSFEAINQIQQLNTTYMSEKMKQENVYDDYISYMDEKFAYDKQREKLEKEKQLAYQEALKENPNLTYEEFMSLQPMTLNLIEEPQPSQALQEFMEKYL